MMNGVELECSVVSRTRTARQAIACPLPLPVRSAVFVTRVTHDPFAAPWHQLALEPAQTSSRPPDEDA
jgi:hypothetical protein